MNSAEIEVQNQHDGAIVRVAFAHWLHQWSAFLEVCTSAVLQRNAVEELELVFGEL